MTWHLDPDTGDVYDHTDSLVGTADGPTYTIPDDVRDILIADYFPSDHSAVTVDHLRAVVEVSAGDVEFGTP